LEHGGRIIARWPTSVEAIAEAVPLFALLSPSRRCRVCLAAEPLG
jgi:hypothetical protein